MPYRRLCSPSPTRSSSSLGVPSREHLAASAHDRLWHQAAVSIYGTMSASGAGYFCRMSHSGTILHYENASGWEMANDVVIHCQARAAACNSVSQSAASSSCSSAAAIWPVAARATERKNAADRAFMPGRLRPHATTQVIGWYRDSMKARISSVAFGTTPN